MKYKDLTKKEIEEYEKQLIEKADNFWVELYGRQEASDVDKLRLLSRQGRIQDTFQHDIMTGYFFKQDLWTNGKTTLKEREKQLILVKTEFGNKIAKVKSATIANIDEIIINAEAKRREIEKIPVQMVEEYKVDKNAILTALKTELQNHYDTSQEKIEKEIIEVFNAFLQNVESRQEQLIQNARSQIQDIQKRQKLRMTHEVEKYSAELEAELTVLEYRENDDDLIKQYNEEIRKINQELNKIKKPIEIEVQEKFKCELCGKVCKSNAGLTSHEKTHESEFSKIEKLVESEGVE